MDRAIPNFKNEVQCVTGDQAVARGIWGTLSGNRAHSILCTRSQAVAETVI